MKKALTASLLLTLMAGAILGAWLHRPAEVDASGHSATRTFASPWVEPGGMVEVTIVAQDFGAFAQVVETLPAGFTFVESSLPDSAVDADGSTFTFTLLGVGEFTYTVEAPRMAGVYSFSGLVADQHRENQVVGGNTGLRVGATPTPTPTATAIPTPTATLTPIPTPTATPEPTPTPAPTATPTATPEPTATAMPESTSTPAPTATSIPVVEAPADEGSTGSSTLVWIWGVLLAVALALVVGGVVYLSRRR